MVKILFDQTQKERGRIHDNFEKLSNILEEEGHKIAVLDTFPIKYSTISNADILVFLCPDGSKLYGHEVKALLRFVDEGGSLAIFANAGGDKGLNTNLNSLLKHFDIEIISNQIFDYNNYDLELESNPVVTKFFKHPITDGIKEVTFVSSCSLNIGTKVKELARTSNDSDPPSSTVLAITTYGLGTVFVCGSYLMFSDKKAGIELRDNKQLAKNIFANICEPSEKLVETEEEKEKTTIETAQSIQKPISKVEIMKEVLARDESDIVKQDILKAISSLQDEVRGTKIEEEAAPKLQREDILQAISIIEELENEISELNIEDQGYKDILLTDMARRKGIDYTQILPYLEKMRERKKQKEKIEQREKKIGDVDVTQVPVPAELPESAKFEKELVWFDDALKAESPQQVKRIQSVGKQAPLIQINELVNVIGELKNSVDVLSANLIHLLSEILLELKEQRKKRR
ncbi:MAG: Gldg family protein [Candidatus Heimdallarchaeaceae archaeon]